MLARYRHPRIVPYGIVVLHHYLSLAIHAITRRAPSNERNWKPEQGVLSEAIFNGPQVIIKNIRNFTYASTTDYSISYYDKSFDLKTLVSVDYLVEPLSKRAAAHTFLSFGFTNGDRIAISIEARKRVEQEYSPLKGLFNNYELMYAIFDERDGVRLRAIHRGNPVYAYPVKAKPDDIRILFTNMLRRANKLIKKPEFYNTFTNSCTTNIARHINEIFPGAIRADLRLLLPMESDALAQELGFIDNDCSLTEVRNRYRINEAVHRHADAEDFSVRIREHRPTLTTD